eukprot:CAMPEP_0113286028 /NCGR_PEP_ID=MMETSP0008_2-20120614/30912_1 /TAXON_ID=97485 /ORGANISM="Prymnesium parvum" /LENGTH=55 /DNA_ID=CAMNT_0000137077 /DNA_START=1 /DNA_END=164 /DNA_ORIENTATION=- /assembly_acc=CAM_ASM_000153
MASAAPPVKYPNVYGTTTQATRSPLVCSLDPSPAVYRHRHAHEGGAARPSPFKHG